MARSGDCGEPSRGIRLWETSPHWAISCGYTFVLFSSPLLSLIADRSHGPFSTTRLPLALGRLERARPLRTTMDASPIAQNFNICGDVVRVRASVGLPSVLADHAPNSCCRLPRRPVGNLHFARFPVPASRQTRRLALSRCWQSKIRLFPAGLLCGPCLPCPSRPTSMAHVVERRNRCPPLTPSCVKGFLTQFKVMQGSLAMCDIHLSVDNMIPREGLHLDPHSRTRFVARLLPDVETDFFHSRVAFCWPVPLPVRLRGTCASVGHIPAPSPPALSPPPSPDLEDRRKHAHRD
jgi:hypothetical protein